MHHVGDVNALTQHITLLHQDGHCWLGYASRVWTSIQEITWTAAGKSLLNVYRETIAMYTRTAAATGKPAALE